MENDQVQMMNHTQTSMLYHATRLGLGRNGGKLLATESKPEFRKSRFNRLSTGFPKRAEQLPASNVTLALPMQPVKTNVFLLRKHRKGQASHFQEASQHQSENEDQHNQETFETEPSVGYTKDSVVSRFLNQRQR